MPDAGSRLAGLLSRPLVVAPMAGGVSTVPLVRAAGEVGALGFLAGGYQPAASLAAQLEALREVSDAPFGVNLFVPGQPYADAAQGEQPRAGAGAAPPAISLTEYVARLAPLAAELGTTVGAPKFDDDCWQAKLDLIFTLRPAVVSFTFGCPSAAEIASLHDADIHVTVTVTSAEEATIATAAGADSLCVQSADAGGHRAKFVNEIGVGDGLGAQPEPSLVELLGTVRAVTSLPLIAAGGISDAATVATVLANGAIAAQIGTALLRSLESGAGETYRAALADPDSPDTVITRAFTGRPARAIRNGFTDAHPDAPAAYPEINSATRPIRAAAAASGRTAALHLWAGTGYRRARKAPAAEILRSLTPAPA